MDNVSNNASGQNNIRMGEPRRQSKTKAKKIKLMGIALGLLAAFVILVVLVLFFYRSSTGSSIDGSKYQAVFFTNGQVYFGKLHPMNSDYMKLDDIFYLQAKTTDSSNPQATSNKTTNDVQLIKLGNEIHGPVDEMIVSKSQILFFENLKSNSRVSESIAKYNSQQKK